MFTVLIAEASAGDSKGAASCGRAEATDARHSCHAGVSQILIIIIIMIIIIIIIIIIINMLMPAPMIVLHI
jgi:t-SNARE complex subunit (syntaxin)